MKSSISSISYNTSVKLEVVQFLSATPSRSRLPHPAQLSALLLSLLHSLRGPERGRRPLCILTNP